MIIHGVSWVDSLPGYRLRQAGETVEFGDYLQIGKHYSLVDGSIWVGDRIEHGGPYESVWTPVLRDLESQKGQL